MCVSLSLQSSLSLSLSAFTLRRHLCLSPLYHPLPLHLYFTFLPDEWPHLGLLDSSLGHLENRSVSGDGKGFVFF